MTPPKRPPRAPVAPDPTAGGLFDMGDVLAAPELGSFHLSADGSVLALARYEYVKSLGARPSRVAVLRLDERGGGGGSDGEGGGEGGGAAPESLVFTSDADGWAPELHDDGRALLFLTDYSGEARPWVASGPDTSPAPVESVARMASVAKWRPGQARRGFGFLSFATREEQGFDDPIVWDRVPAAGFRHLFYAFDEREPPRRITSGPEDIYDFTWTAGGEALAVLAAPSFEMERHLDGELRLHHPDDGRLLARHPLPRGLNAFLSASPAGTHLAFLGHGTGERAGKPDLFTLRLDDGAVQCVSESTPGYVSRYDWAPFGRGLIFPAAEGVRTRLYHAALDGHGVFGAPSLLWEPRGTGVTFVGGLSVARRARRIALRVEGPRTPVGLVVASIEEEGGAPRLGAARLVTPRSVRKEARIPGDATVVEGVGDDGRPVEAIVLHPRRGTPAPRPLCVWLHGGPNEFCALSYQPWWQLFVARGFTVLAPNFRGSGSYATERVRWNVGDLGGGDAGDVLGAIDAAVSGAETGGWIDRRSVLVFGWSYGAFLAFHVARRLGERDAAEGRSPSLRRVVAGGGVYDWLSHYGQAELRFFWRDYLGGSPLLDAAQADARSPVRHAARVVAAQPACRYLLVHGLNDGRASPQQSRTMYRALREAGGQAELLLYPREAHLLVEPEHVRDLLDRATAPL